MSEKPLLNAKGIGGQLELYEDKVRIKRGGAIAFMTQGLKGDKDIYISSIASIQFRDAGLNNGYIQFAFMGGQEAKGAFFQATQDENSVVFNVWQKKPFIAIKEALEKKMSLRDQKQPTTNLNDLEKLSDFKNKGIITEEEYNAKKKQILGL